MTKSRFRALVAELKAGTKRPFSDRTIEIAERLLVRGEQGYALSRQYDLTHQQVYAIKRRFEAAAGIDPRIALERRFRAALAGRGITFKMRADVVKALQKLGYFLSD
jgi:hypothetical protein